jgi:SAM-dependent methyltransferase
MSNMYGYSDYNGPTAFAAQDDELAAATTLTTTPFEKEEEEEEEESNPLQAGFWMEGDSLAPPCGTAIATIHSLLDFAEVKSTDVLYDLGCGDGRVCLEAYAKYNCRSVGVEVEVDLVERAQHLISSLPRTENELTNERLPRVVLQDLQELLDDLLDRLASPNNNDEPQSAEHPELPLPTIIVLYLLPESLAELQDRFISLLRLLPPPFRILCNTWGLPRLQAEKKTKISEENGAITPLHLYTKNSLPDQQP